jgi:hypothetical protein
VSARGTILRLVAPPQLCTRVEVHFNDGKTNVLTGQAAERWHQAVEFCAKFAVTQGYVFPELPWKVRTP